MFYGTVIRSKPLAYRWLTYWFFNYGDYIYVSVSGLGFGILSGAFSTVNVLADMVGPGTIGIYGDSKYFFVATGNQNVTCFKFYIVLNFNI